MQRFLFEFHEPPPLWLTWLRCKVCLLLELGAWASILNRERDQLKKRNNFTNSYGRRISQGFSVYSYCFFRSDKILLKSICQYTPVIRSAQDFVFFILTNFLTVLTSNIVVHTIVLYGRSVHQGNNNNNNNPNGSSAY